MSGSTEWLEVATDKITELGSTDNAERNVHAILKQVHTIAKNHNIKEVCNTVENNTTIIHSMYSSHCAAIKQTSTALIHEKTKIFVDLLVLLMNKGADINIPGKDGSTVHGLIEGNAEVRLGVETALKEHAMPETTEDTESLPEISTDSAAALPDNFLAITEEIQEWWSACEPVIDNNDERSVVEVFGPEALWS